MKFACKFYPYTKYNNSMWGQLASGIVSLGGAVLGAVRSAKANRDALKELNKKEARENARYARRYNESTLDRADMQRLIRQAGEEMRRRDQAAEGKMAVMGGGEEALAAQKEANAQAMGDVMGSVAAQAAVDRRAEDDRHQQALDGISDERAAIKRQQGQVITNAAEQVMGTMAGVAASADGAIQEGKDAKRDMHERAVKAAQAPQLDGEQIHNLYELRKQGNDAIRRNALSQQFPWMNKKQIDSILIG